jgi:hypothetical protein
MIAMPLPPLPPLVGHRLSHAHYDDQASAAVAALA